MPPIRQRLETYAITISTFHRQPHFETASYADLFLQTILPYRAQGKFQLHGFAIMPDHVHLLITPAIDQPTSRSIQLIKGGYSFAARNLTPSEIWHTGHHEHRIRNLADFDNQLRYIANNPSASDLAADYPYVHIHATNSGSLDSPPASLVS